MRINKYIADQGWASRREADTLIEAGKVLVNGKKAVIGQQISENDKVTLDTKAVKTRVYLAYYKGRGVITHSPEDNEIDIATKIKKDYSLKEIYPVGRLDKDSEGLMILTNDGRVTGPLLDPDSGHEKEYEVTVDKPIKNQLIKKLETGVDIEGYTTKPTKAEKINDKRFKIVLTEGKKHQIRRMCAALGYQVQSLKRVRVLNIKLDKLKPNQYRKLSKPELKNFLQKLNIK